MKGVLVTIGLTAAGRRRRADPRHGHRVMRMSIQRGAQRLCAILCLVLSRHAAPDPARGVYSGLPQLGIKFGVITCALIGLILNEAAYLAEIVRSGFMAVSAGSGRLHGP